MRKYPLVSVIHLTKTLVLAGLMVVTSAKATTIYDNLGAVSGGGDPVWLFGPYDSFTSAGTDQALTGLQFALSGSGLAGTLTVGLYGDSSATPGALITTLGMIDTTTITTGVNDYTLALLSHPVLTANTRCWIGLSDTDHVRWAWTSSWSGVGVASEYFANSTGVYANKPNGPYMMQLTTGSVPDVGSTASLLGLAVAGLIGLRRKLA